VTSPVDGEPTPIRHAGFTTGLQHAVTPAPAAAA